WRAAQMLKIAERNNWLLDIALDHLTFGRAELYERILLSGIRESESAQISSLASPALSAEDQRGLTSAATKLDTAVDGLRRAGVTDYGVRGLLARTWRRFLTGARPGPDSSQEDLDEAWKIAERAPMKPHMTDIPPPRARLFFREKEYPWNKNPDG